MKLIISITALLLCLSCHTHKVMPNSVLIESEAVEKNTAKNIIFLIGDGMGIGQITAGTYANNNKTALERFEITGLHKPYSGDNLVTDSAAAATSFASGVKTFNGAIGMNMDTIPVQTLLEEAEKKGLKTGLVATSTIVHATPASYIAHNVTRQDYEGIALDFLDTEVDYFVGGGKKFFDRREDEKNLITELQSKGYHMGNYLEEFNTFISSITPSKDKIGYLTADESPIPAAQGRDYLEAASLFGIDFLDKQSDNGFFLMIEGSQIDWGGHANDKDYIISEFLEYNRVIDKVLDWAEKDGETLVVVTADHETGGFTIQPGSTKDSLVTAFTTPKHSGDFIPVFATGPGAKLFSGLYENTEIYFKMREVFGWSEAMGNDK